MYVYKPVAFNLTMYLIGLQASLLIKMDLS